VTDTNGCVGNDQINIVISGTKPMVDLGEDMSICDTASIVLQTDSMFPNYLWSDGQTTETIIVDTTGIYWLEVTHATGCPARDSITITVDLCENIQEYLSMNVGVYPNPAGNEINLTLNGESNGAGYIRMMSINGQVVQTSIISTDKSGQFRLNIQDLPTGAYIIEVSVNDKRYFGKVMKQ